MHLEQCVYWRRQEEQEDEEDMFQPQLGNVIFASAHDGWAFRPAQFAALYAAKLGANPAALSKVLLLAVGLEAEQNERHS